MPAGPPLGNKNAEKWTLIESELILNQAIVLSNEIETSFVKVNDKTIEVKGYKFDFIGEVARELGYYKSLFSWLIERHHSLKHIHTQLVENLEANCYCNGKKGVIKEASSIMNLKSNHKWTDRQTFEGDINLKKDVSEIFPKELDE
jgi:hypothetical protein